MPRKKEPPKGPYDDWSEEETGAFAGFARWLDRYFDERVDDDDDEEVKEQPPESGSWWDRPIFGGKK